MRVSELFCEFGQLWVTPWRRAVAHDTKILQRSDTAVEIVPR